jgi:plastocyanin
VIDSAASRGRPLTHVVIEAGKEIQLRNIGGRPHTFTSVAEFGGGRVVPLNVGTQPAPECLEPDVVTIPPGNSTRMTAEGDGIQRFQCCFHPWMRATVRVVSTKDN